MENGVNLNEILLETQSICENGKINITLLKYLHKGREKNFALSLPDNLNPDFLKGFCISLSSFQDKSSHIFDPIGKEDDETYEYIDLSNIQEQWAYIKQMIKEAALYKEKSELAPSASLSITEISIGDSTYTYYLGGKQTPLDKYLRRHHVIMSANDQLEDRGNDKVFLFSCDVDFVIREDNTGRGYAFALNRENFCKIFNYDEEMKAKATRDIEKVKKWEFLCSTDLIYKRINQKNVYHRLAKVFSDPVYMDQIEKTPAATLKRNLLERSDGNFDENDFEGDLIKLTDKNLEKVMKMIAKGFRYNFFANRAEES